MKKKLLVLALVPLLSGCDLDGNDDVIVQPATQNATDATTTDATTTDATTTDAATTDAATTDAATTDAATTDATTTDAATTKTGYTYDETIDANEFAQGLSNEGSQAIKSTALNTPVMYTDGSNYVLAYRSDKELDHEDDVQANGGVYLTAEERANPEEIFYLVNSFTDAASASAFEASYPVLYVNGQAVQYTVQKVDYKLVK